MPAAMGHRGRDGAAVASSQPPPRPLHGRCCEASSFRTARRPSSRPALSLPESIKPNQPRSHPQQPRARLPLWMPVTMTTLPVPLSPPLRPLAIQVLSPAQRPSPRACAAYHRNASVPQCDAVAPLPGPRNTVCRSAGQGTIEVRGLTFLDLFSGARSWNQFDPASVAASEPLVNCCLRVAALEFTGTRDGVMPGDSRPDQPPHSFFPVNRQRQAVLRFFPRAAGPSPRCLEQGTFAGCAGPACRGRRRGRGLSHGRSRPNRASHTASTGVQGRYGTMPEPTVQLAGASMGVRKNGGHGGARLEKKRDGPRLRVTSSGYSGIARRKGPMARVFARQAKSTCCQTLTAKPDCPCRRTTGP